MLVLEEQCFMAVKIGRSEGPTAREAFVWLLLAVIV